MTQQPLWKLNASSLRAGYARGEFTPGQVLASILDRIEDVNPKVNAFAHLDVEGARHQAAASTARWKAGKPLGPVDGMALSVKDNITVAGLPCSWGTAVFKDFVPAEDEAPVQRVRDAGAIILGKTRCSEFSTGRGIVSTPLYGTTRNPWRLDVTPGSSSAGAVACVASGMGPLALATDGGGSVRTPCSHSGLVGLKPTTGRVARSGGLPIILGGREVVGPIARTSADLGDLFSIIAHSHPLDGSSWGFEESAGQALPARLLRILFVPKIGDNLVMPEVAAAIARVAENIAAMGHIVEIGEQPFDPILQERSAPLITQAGLAWLARDKEWRGRVHPYYEDQIERGMKLGATDYVAALDGLRTIQRQVGEGLQRFDLILSPVTGSPAWGAEEPAKPYFNVFTSFVNSAGVPAVSIPAAVSSDGRPIGFQLVGRYGSDWGLLEFARQYEALHPWADRWPPI